MNDFKTRLASVGAVMGSSLLQFMVLRKPNAKQKYNKMEALTILILIIDNLFYLANLNKK
jgi:hypothetical protein